MGAEVENNVWEVSTSDLKCSQSFSAGESEVCIATFCTYREVSAFSSGAGHNRGRWGR